MAICSKCRKPNKRKNQRYCIVCHLAYMREWRKTHRLKGEARKKAICRAYTKVLVKRGKIEVETCKICGKKAQMHHPDYNNPRRVEWFCRKHHLEHHKKLSRETKCKQNN